MGVTKCKTVDWHLSTYSLEHNFFYRNLTGISSLFCLIKTFTHFTTRLINEAHSWIWICRLQRTNGSLLLFLAERYLFMLASLPNILSFFKSVPAQTIHTFVWLEAKTLCSFCSILNTVAIWDLLYPGHDPKQSTNCHSSNCAYTLSGIPAWDHHPTLVFGWFFSSVSALFFPNPVTS